MKTRLFAVHGWGGNPESDWFLWLNAEMSKLGYDVLVPEMPDTTNPKIDSWVNKLATAVGGIRQSDIFIGHSIGCQTILRFINSTDENQVIDKVILIAPWWYLTLEGDEEKIKSAPWLKTDLDFEKIRSRIKKIVCVFSDNDSVVPLNLNINFFKEKLNAEVIIEKNMGHFSGDDSPKITKLPLLVDLLK